MNSGGNLNSVSQSPIDWTISPNVIKVPANSQITMLNVIAKLKNSYTMKPSLALQKSHSGQSKDGEELHEEAGRLKRSNTMGVQT